MNVLTEHQGSDKVKNMLEVRNISKIFFLPKPFFGAPFQKNKEILALDKVSFKLNPGRILALLGPNGAGKTTLLKILSTLILPNQGTATILGYDLIKEGPRLKSKIGLVFSEEKGFYRRLSGRQNLEFFGMLYNLSSRQIKKRILCLANLLEIDDLDKPFQNYSTGLKHRLGMVKCLLSEPEIIFMDEPTSRLDPASAWNFRKFIKEKLVREFGKTVFLTTHQIEEAESLADTIAIMDKGRIQAFGKPDEIKIKNGLNKDSTLEELYLKTTAPENEA